MSDPKIEESTPNARLLVIIASTRPGRRGLPIGQWIVEAARDHGAFDIQLADLAEINLPFMDEPNHPSLGKYTHQHTWEWSAMVDGADAIVIVTPEYNYGFNAPLKNALDYLHREWQYKPVGLVSYGGVSSGLRSAQMLKQVLTTLNMMPLNEAAPISLQAATFDDDDHFQPTEQHQKAAVGMFDALLRWNGALKQLRS